MTNYAEKYKPTKLSVLNKRSEEAKVDSYENQNGDRIKRITVSKDGVYKFRMLPAHPSEGAVSIEPRTVFWLPAMVTKKDDNGSFVKDANGEYVKVQSRKPYFSAKVHGGSDYDLVDTYIELVKKKADELYPGSDEATIASKKQYLTPVLGSYGTNRVQGIVASQGFIFYGLEVDDDDNLGTEVIEYEVKPSVNKAILRKAATESGGEPIGTDGFFTDISTGSVVKVTVDSVAGRTDAKLWYSVDTHIVRDRVNINGKMTTVIKDFEIPDDIMAKFDTMPPFKDYRTKFNHYTLKYQALVLHMFD